MWMTATYAAATRLGGTSRRECRSGSRSVHAIFSKIPFSSDGDQGPKEKKGIPRDQFVATVAATLDDIQANLFKRAQTLRESVIQPIDLLSDFEAYFTPKNPDRPEIHGGFALSHWTDEPAVEEKLKELKVTARCIPLDGPEESGKCIFTGKPSSK